MEHVPSFTRIDQHTKRAQKVRVLGRDDIGELVDGGKNFGTNPPMYCVGIHFPETGECVYYDKSRIEYVD
jgi:hypothetical protein